MDSMISIIPQPTRLHATGDALRLSNQSPLRVDPGTPEIISIADYLCTELRERHRLMLRPEAGAATSGISIILTTDPALATDGAYRLTVSDNGAIILAGTTGGLFYGVQTFLQLLPCEPGQGNDVIVPGVEIVDQPRFGWRGMHLDVCRHFFPADFIKKYIDLLARHKMNRFHWHLTDDQGWRIEIKRYPLLTEIGGRRTEADGSTYGGFYTQEEIRDIVAYAERRFVTIVPEIEMPGHALAALAAYPEYSCTGGPFRVATTWGVFDDVYCPGHDATFTFLEQVLSETAALFPGQYLHIGGDECPKVRWHGHKPCQDRMKEAGLKSEDELQAYFVSRMARYIETLEKRLVGWDEILDGGAPAQAIIMAWRDVRKGTEAARSGHDVVMTPMPYCYFDHYQGQENEPKAIGGFTPLEKVYSFEPIPPDMPRELARHILGAQGNVWTEYMADTNHVEYMAFPRLCALAEVLWSSRETRHLPGFIDRLRHHLKRLDNLGVNYRRLSD
ncbi:MAG: beta-N-acetylhexosaminidase [candidate division Zixibacteria bacterium]|nr:beta-N-acetylhexosaminidase [candidate division Zixibacteria bacterium]